ncbi:MAG: hypothetical protein CUN52_03475 [Phototrophicales bacterium]|nr:MAG: hypothetical protein CUN52_03475 [Phototrophicales bacterium]
MKNQKLFVDETGTKGMPSIVFLHGIGTSSWMWWMQVEALSGFHCLTIDLPGHGRSNHIAWHSFADTAHKVATIIQEHATNGRAHIVGLSLGGYIALVMLQHHADILNHVIVSGVTIELMPNRSLLNPQLWLMSFLFKRRWFLKMQANSLHLPANKKTAFIENLQAMSMTTYRKIAEEAVDFYIPPTLNQVMNPTLVVAGGRESKIITQSVYAIPQIMPNAQGWFAPKPGHGWNVEAPTLFNAMIQAWIDNKPLPSQLQKTHDRK